LLGRRAECARRLGMHAPEKQMLLRPAPQDSLRGGPLARDVTDAVDSLGLRAYHARYDSGGACNQSFQPPTTVEAQVFFHATEVFSSRKVARKLHKDMAVRVLADGSFPAHRALNDIRAMQLQEPGELFVQVVRLAREFSLVKLDTIAVDGTRIRTNASQHEVMSFERRVRAAAELKCRPTPCQRKCSPAMKPSSTMPGSACRRSWSGGESGLRRPLR
jgi:hypothetical protein